MGYKNLPRKPRPLVAGINWQKIFKKDLVFNKYDSMIIYVHICKYINSQGD